MDKKVKKFIVFTDLADYTLKSSLLTIKQLKELIIDKQDELILPLIKEFNGELVKYIGDSYLILFDDLNNSIKFSVSLQKKLRDYNSKIKINLKKIELKIVINYGELLIKNTQIGKEYFGDAINIASRILEETPKNKIIITNNVYELLKDTDLTIVSLGDFTFKGLIYKIPLYEIVYDRRLKKSFKENYKFKKKIEKRVKEVDKTIFNISSVAFLLTIQPVPIFDRYFIALLHIYLLKEIALLYGINLSSKDIKEILTTIALSIGGIYSTNQLLTSLGKIGLPFVGGYLFAPANFALTYGLGKVFSNYFYYKTEKSKLTNENIKEIFLGTRETGLSIAKKQKDKILTTGKKYKDLILKKLDDFKDIYEDLKDILKKVKK